jgi:tetratricopeptide (TPR) repeat protein
MVVDPRGDHSFRVPRPDLTASIGTPNACNDCHTDRNASWASASVDEWYGAEREPHYGEALEAGRRRLPGASRALRALIEDDATPAIVRATAVALLPPAPESLAVVRGALADDEPLVRLAALQATEGLDPAMALSVTPTPLEDPRRLVRHEAARVLASVPRQRMSAEQRASFDAALAEYREALAFNADRADAHFNLGLLETRLGRLKEAEREYWSAIDIDDRFQPAYVNLADLYRMQGRDEEGERVLRGALAVADREADLHYSLGLLLARLERYDEALESLRNAVELDRDLPRYAYVYGVALHSAGRPADALRVLAEAHQRHPGDRDVLFGLATISRDAGDLEAAVRSARKLVELSPGDAAARQLLSRLEAAAR